MKKIVYFVLFSLLVTFFYLSVNNTYSLFTKKIDKTGSINTIKSEATFLNGNSFNAKIKSISGDSNATWGVENETIINIERSATLLINPTNSNIVSDSNSIMPIYAWFNNGTLYYYSEANTLYMNENANLMFARLSNVESIDVSTINTSRTRYMLDIFGYDYKLTTLDVSNFDTSIVENMQGMFFRDYELETIDVSGFNTSSLVNMQGMFQNAYKVEVVDMSNFDLTNVTNSSGIFNNANSLKEYKTPKVYPNDTTQKIGLPKTMYDENMVAYTTLGKSTTPTSPTETLLKEGYTVSFDADGGTVSPSSKVVRKDGTYETLPMPTKDGYTFSKWVTVDNLISTDVNDWEQGAILDASGKNSNNNDTYLNRIRVKNFMRISPDTKYVISTNNSLSLQVRYIWFYDEDMKFVSNSRCFAYNCEFTTPSNAYYFRTVIQKASQTVPVSLSDLASTNINLQAEIESTTELTYEHNHTLKAIYTPNTYTVSFDVNGGKHPSNNELFSFDASTNQIDGTLNDTLWGDDYLYFDGKKTTFANLGEINSDYMTMNVDFSMTYQTSSPTIMSNMQGGGLGIFINSDNNIVGQVHINGSYRSIATNYSIELGKRYNATLSYDGKVEKFFVNGELIGTINIEGVIKSTNESTVMVLGGNPKGSIIEGNAFNGKIYKASLYENERYDKTVTYDSTYGTLPQPTRDGYSFAGWNTSEDGTGSTITNNSNVTITSNQILYAKWSDATNPMLSLSKETYWEQDLSTWTLYDSTVDNDGVLTLNTDDAYAISDFIPVNGEFYYNVFDAYTEAVAPNYGSRGGAHWIIYYFDENKDATTAPTNKSADGHGYAMTQNTWYNEIYWLNSKNILDLWKEKERYSSNIKYIKIKYLTTTDYSRSPTKIRNLKVYGQMPNDFYLINIDSSDNSGIAQTKYAKGNQNKAYFTNNGTVVNSNQIRVTENGIYTVFVKDGSGNTTIETIEITNIPVSVSFDSNGGSFTNDTELLKFDGSTQTIAGTVNGATFGTDYLEFSGSSSSWVNLGQMNSDYMLMNVEFSLTEYLSSYQIIIGNIQSGGMAICLNADKQILGEAFIDGSYRRITTSYGVDLNTRYNVTLYYDGIVEKMFVNGTLIGTINIEGVITPPDYSTVMALGGNPSGNTVDMEYFKGRIYKASLYEIERYSKDLIYNSTYGELPIPSRQGYIFGGWYLDNNYTTQVTSESIVTLSTDSILYAKWDVLSNLANNNVESSLYNIEKTTDGAVLNGVNSYIQVDNIDYNSTKSITLDFVAKVADTTSCMMLFESSNNWNRYLSGWGITVNETRIKDDFRVTTQWNNRPNNEPSYYNIKNASISQGTFKHYTVIIDTTRQYNDFIKIYVNGQSVQVNETDQNHTYDITDMTFENYPFYIGRRIQSDTLFSDVIFKNIRLYNKALTEQEIQSNNQGNYVNTDLVFGYDFE